MFLSTENHKKKKKKLPSLIYMPLNKLSTSLYLVMIHLKYIGKPRKKDKIYNKKRKEKNKMKMK